MASILVADDGESNRKLARLVLRRAGVKVDEAENGQQAVEHFRVGLGSALAGAAGGALNAGIGSPIFGKVFFEPRDNH